jgi:uncharacterized protein (TIGR03000 family)
MSEAPEPIFRHLICRSFFADFLSPLVIAYQGFFLGRGGKAMSKRGVTIGGVVALTLAGLLLCIGPASAQRFGRAGWAPAYGWNYGYANGYTPYWAGYPTGWFGYNTYSYSSPQNFTYGNYYHPFSGNYWGYSYNEPQVYSFYDAGAYSTPGYTGYYAPAYTGQYAASGTNMRYEGAYESSDENLNNPNAISVNVRVPANAKIWFDGQPTQQQGGFRQFISPPVQSGKAYSYTIKAEWTENGQKVEKTKEVNVHAGDRVTLDMLQGKNGVVTFGNAPGGATRTGTGASGQGNINRTTTPPSETERSTVPDNTNKKPSPGATGTTPTGLKPTTRTPATPPPPPGSNRSTTPEKGSTTPEKGSTTPEKGPTTPEKGPNKTPGTGSPGTSNTGGINNPDK